ncbi:MAG: hypothetical protein Q9164_003355 [Protoblastenia rupestris]
MADVRSLLRNERASRRIDHPQASYSATGTLECTVCHIPLKSDIEVWNKHLTSTQHAMRAERLRLSTKAPPSRIEIPTITKESSKGSKKRKASDAEDEDSRKKTKPVIPFTERLAPDPNNADTPNLPSKQIPTPLEPTTSSLKIPSHLAQLPPHSEPIDEAEWAAFERDIATPPPSSPKAAAPSALMAAATISAAPLSAAEIAAREKEEERVSGRERREVELEAEKEDAARALEEEFDEMEGLEERVRRLREKREMLRMGVGGGVGGEGGVDAEDSGIRDGDGNGWGGYVDEQSEEEDEDFDEWGFGR